MKPEVDSSLAALRESKRDQSDPLLDEDEAAKYLKTAARTLSIWRSVGRYNLPFVKIGRLVRYKKSDLDAFIARRTVTMPDAECDQ